MNRKLVAITGATGSLGAEVARDVAAAEIPVRLIVRDATRASHFPGADVREAVYQDTDAFTQAVEDVDTVFLVSLPESDQRRNYHRSAVEACRRAGVNRIVYTSLINASRDATFTLARDHYDTELAIEEAGIPFISLRDNFYTDMLPLMVTDGVIRGPGGSGKFAPVARTDVAAVATSVIQNEIGTTERLDVTGPELIDLHDAARLLSDITGEPVRYEEETIEEAYRSRAKFHATKVELDGWISSYKSIAEGEMSIVSDTVQRLTGRPALTPREYLEQLLTENASA
ncbi:SDR family oxidoreductase [Aporhodopirellula aestuarii]|uniref:SDR family oxidoreductase n=1 Tax=Aporhodopirellula aestuarii TaxID=2950107 RepID=A0ABT0UBU9_9BACT|nr:SDR family oxidoreductase [Aporhodopirellula aestuarii]MCM2373811.1 SDR family oxidoreductase [Aporhodopirellula aestuarii]